MKKLRISVLLASGLIACSSPPTDAYTDTQEPPEVNAFPFFTTVVRGDSTNFQAVVSRRSGNATGGTFVVINENQGLTTKLRSTTSSTSSTTAVIAVITSPSTPLGPYNFKVDATVTGFKKVSTTFGVNIVAAAAVRANSLR